MSLNANVNFTRLVEHLQAQGGAAQLCTEDTQEYRDFLAAFPLERLPQLSMDEYCVGKGDGKSFCWWIERGLVPVLGRYMPGTAKGHILYFQPDGSLYKNRHLADLGDEEALRYTLKVQSCIAATDPEDMRWVDDDQAIYQRAGVEPLVTVGEGRKLRLLSCYHPSDTLPISSSAHLAHFLVALGFPEADVPPFRQPVARMLLLRDYYLKACAQVPGLSTYGFMRGLYSEEVGIAPKKDDDAGKSRNIFVPVTLKFGEPAPWGSGLITHVRLTGRDADTSEAGVNLKLMRRHADEAGIACIADFQNEFKGRQKKDSAERSMQTDLRHFAGKLSDGNPQNKALLELGYLADVNTESGKPTYLLTWNPEHFKLGGDAGVTLGDEVDWNCHSRKPQPGDVVYLVRLGKEPRGIVARGLVTEGAHDAPDWKDAGKTRNYIRFSIDDHRPDCASGLLPMALLNKAISGQRWNPQSSGVEIKPALAAKLDKLWSVGEGKHSLHQFVEWSKSASDDYFPNWLQRYRAITEFATAIKSGEQPLDEAALRQLWLEPDNGVFAVGAGLMPTAEFTKNLDWLRGITEQVISDPTLQCYEAVEAKWREAVGSGAFSRMKQALCARQYSTFEPEALTTILWNKDCAFLLEALKEQFQLHTNVGKDWFSLNQGIMQSLRMAGVAESAPLENNIAMRLLQMALAEKPGDIKEDDEDLNMTVPLNQILFGPPGTGKTYNTVNEALRILNPELVAKPGVTRAELTSDFQRYVDSGQLVFCTFHQSFSYEDFVEGLRAVPEAGQLHYKVEPGVFKRLCDEARRGEGVLSADEVLNAFLEEVTETPVTLTTVRGKPFEVRYKPGNSTFTCLPRASENAIELPANIEHVRLYLKGQKPASVYCESYVRGIADHLRGKLEKAVTGKLTGLSRPHVLVIDEINRGNVSRIFGELISLIETSKREGSVEALSVTLPYSKELFSVPSNVYLISTMNTADRSLSGLDIALRRRFTFVEMPSKPELLKDVWVDGVNIAQLLRVMNQRIEVLLDRDHCLGHAYFMPLSDDNSLACLEAIFRNQILPLLQEYFFEDWERIAWVLNDQRAKSSMPFLQKPESELNLAVLFGNAVAGKLNDQRWELNDQAFGSIDSYRNILG